MTRILPLGEKASLAVGTGNSTTVGNATVVRVLSTAGAAVVVRTENDGTVIGSFTTPVSYTHLTLPTILLV